ncbi:AraC family transcriptional regulator [Burkholderia sp. Ac-20353]|uniref:helix-turn-helix domain-containing protein n=1 Tax=Burkholderia sp. Ac-20353 TaxID=2703894 RepID=UPI00197B25B1
MIFGEFWAGYVGMARQNSPHAHIATQLAVGLGCNVIIESHDGPCQCKGVMIGPRVEHVARADGDNVAFLYISPHAPLGRALQARLGEAGIAELPPDVTDSITSTLSRDVGPDSFAAIVSALSSRWIPDVPPAFDLRLQLAVNMLRNDQGDLGAMARAAAAVGLSEPRLRSLALRQLGVPLSQWMIWRKLERSARAIANGASLADAAIDGGFSDQAHLARTMRRMFGITAGQAMSPLRSASDSFKHPACVEGII